MLGQYNYFSTEKIIERNYDYKKYNHFSRIILVLVLIVFNKNSYAGSFIDAEEKQKHEITEEELKLAFIYRFMRFVNNHKKIYHNQDLITFCISGNVSKTDHNLYRAAPRQTVYDKNVEIKVNPEQLDSCNVIYYTNNMHDPLDTSNISVKKKVITVGDSPAFIKKGGMISFYKLRGNVRFQISGVNSKKGGVFFDAKLLELGEVQ